MKSLSSSRLLRAMGSCALLCSLLIGAPGAVRAAGTIYVGPGNASTGGSCTDPDFGVISSGDAEMALESAINDASNPDHVIICAGTYDLPGTVNIDNDAVHIEGVSASSVKITQTAHSGWLLMVQQDDVTISGITVDGASHLDGLGNGAGVLVWEGETLTVNDSVFKNNEAVQGAAIWMDAGSTLITHNNLFQGNVAEDGGALWFGEDATGELHDDEFEDNHAVGDIDLTNPEGGAIYMEYNIDGFVESHLEVTGALFSGNTSDEDGGGICVQEATVVYITDSTFVDNHAVGIGDSTEGGAVYVDLGELQVFDSIFTGNSSYEDGGAVAVDDASLSHMILQNNRFTGNQAYGDSGADGGAVYFMTASAEILGNTFSRNQSERDGGAAYGGWVREDVEEPNEFLAIDLEIKGNRFISNRAGTYGGALAVESQAQSGDASRNRFAGNQSRYGSDVAQLGGGTGCPVSRSETLRAWRRSGAHNIVAACVN